MIQTITSPTQLQEVLIRESIVVVDFFATWCEPCKWLDEILEIVDSNLSNPVSILKIDVDKFQIIAKQFQVQSVPVLLIFRDNELIWRMNGFLSANELIDKIIDISRGTVISPASE